VAAATCWEGVRPCCDGVRPCCEGACFIGVGVAIAAGLVFFQETSTGAKPYTRPALSTIAEVSAEATNPPGARRCPNHPMPPARRIDASGATDNTRLTSARRNCNGKQESWQVATENVAIPAWMEVARERVNNESFAADAGTEMMRKRCGSTPHHRSPWRQRRTPQAPLSPSKICGESPPYTTPEPLKASQ